MIGLYSINLRVMGKANISLLRMENVYTVFENMGLEPTWATITLGAISVAAIVCLLYWFFGTELGCAIRATGNNPYMVRAQGINTNTMIIIGLVISNGLVSLGAVSYTHLDVYKRQPSSLLLSHKNFAVSTSKGSKE